MSARILVADSSDSTVNAIRFALRSMGFDLVRARTGDQGISLIRERDFDLILCDVMMPRGGGWDVLRHLQTHNIPTPVILITAVDHVDTVVDLMQGGAYDVVSKPFMPGELLSSVRRGLEFARLMKERNRLEADNRAYREGLEQRVDDQSRLISSMLNLSGELNTVSRMEDALDLLSRTVERTIGCRKVSLVLLDGPDRMRLATPGGVDPVSGQLSALGIEEELALEVAHKGELVLSDRGHPLVVGDTRVERAFAAVPLSRPGDPDQRIFGVLNVTNKDINEFTLEDTRVLKAIADAAASAIANIRGREEIEQGYYDTVKALAMALEAKDPYTRGHSQRVTEMSVTVAAKLGLVEGVVEQIRLAGLLHDIGKIGVPERIILKPGRLSESEYRAIQGHPLIGENMVKHISFLETARTIIRQHHERVDGRGYPDGLHRDEISVGARIMAVADAFDAMRTDRPYRKAMRSGEARAELLACVGTQFDDEVVQAFIEASDEMEDGRYQDRWSTG